MTEQQGPSWPQGRFKRMWLEMEVEVVDETALRAYTLANHVDAEGNDLGLRIPGDLEQRMDMALTHALAQVLSQGIVTATPQTGVALSGLSGPYVRILGEDGGYAETVIGPMPHRHDDGTLAGGPTTE